MANAHSIGAVASAQVPFFFEFGTEPKKLHRANSPDTSVDAAHSVDTTALESKVLAAVRQFPGGCIQDQVLGLFPGFPYSSVTARFRALLDKGMIRDTGDRRPGRSGRGQRVLVGV